MDSAVETSSKRQDAGLVEIGIGWTAAMLSTVLVFLLPGEFLVYVPFLFAALIMAIQLLFRTSVLHGLALILCTCISAPALAWQELHRQVPDLQSFVWRGHSTERSGPAQTETSEPMRAAGESRAAASRVVSVPSVESDALVGESDDDPTAILARNVPAMTSNGEAPPHSSPKVLAEARLDDITTNRRYHASWDNGPSFDYVQVAGSESTLLNGGFEAGLMPWSSRSEHAAVTLATDSCSEGRQSLKMQGSWGDWGWNETSQAVFLKEGETVEISARVLVSRLDTSGEWLVAGIKFESSDGGDAAERVVDSHSPMGGWIDLKFQTTARVTGLYTLRCLLCGGRNGYSTVEVYFDDLQLRKLSGPV
jgi:hypothetical protein